MSKRLVVTLTLIIMIFLVIVGYWSLFPRTGVIDVPGEGIYRGQLRGYTFHGYGVYESYVVKGTSYEGEWKNGLFHGQGELTYADGTRLQGTFIDGRINGWAISISPDGEIHEYYFDHDGQVVVSISMVVGCQLTRPLYGEHKAAHGPALRVRFRSHIVCQAGECSGRGGLLFP